MKIVLMLAFLQAVQPSDSTVRIPIGQPLIIEALPGEPTEVTVNVDMIVPPGLVMTDSARAVIIDEVRRDFARQCDCTPSSSGGMSTGRTLIIAASILGAGYWIQKAIRDRQVNITVNAGDVNVDVEVEDEDGHPHRKKRKKDHGG
jgi:hypothetical protein